MKPGKLVLGVLMAMCVGSASATVITFDDLSGAGLLASNYGGLSWNGSWGYYDATQAPYTAASGKERVYNYGTASFNFLSDVQFDGAFFAGRNSVYFQLFNDGVLVATTSTLALSATPTFLSSGYTGAVDQVRVFGSPGFFVMDDVTYQAATSIPEPASLALGGIGLVGLLAGRRKRS